MWPSRCIIAVLLLAACLDAAVAQVGQGTDSLRSAVASPAEVRLSFSRPTPLNTPWLEQQQEFELALPYLLAPLPTTPYPFLTSYDGPQEPDLTAAWRLQRAREEKNSALYTVLGTVQLGGVAYLAYRHVKKYGFFR